MGFTLTRFVGAPSPSLLSKLLKKKQTHTWVQEAPLDRFSVLYCFIVYMFRGQNPLLIQVFKSMVGCMISRDSVM